MRPFERVILSCDANPKYSDFWPIVRRVWKKLFGVEVFLGLVADDHHGTAMPHQNDIYRVTPVSGIPIANQAKVARYWIASLFGDDISTMINDIDLLPLDKAHVLNLVGNRPKDTLVTIGSELYTGAESGKFMAGYLTAEARIFRALTDPKGLGWEDWIKSFVGLRQFDSKEDISNPIHSEDPNCFSDESLLRYLLWKNPVSVQHRRMPFWPYTDGALCRSNWKLDPDKLKAGYYKEAHLLRPYRDHVAKIQPIIDHIEA